MDLQSRVAIELTALVIIVLILGNLFFTDSQGPTAFAPPTASVWDDLPSYSSGSNCTTRCGHRCASRYDVVDGCRYQMERERCARIIGCRPVVWRNRFPWRALGIAVALALLALAAVYLIRWLLWSIADRSSNSQPWFPRVFDRPSVHAPPSSGWELLLSLGVLLVILFLLLHYS
jgi:hypothetical protein